MAVRSPNRPARVTVLAGNATGLLLVLVGWWQVAGRRDVASQVSWLCLSVTGLLVAGVANGLWFALGRRALLDARLRLRTAAVGRIGRRNAVSAPEGHDRPGDLVATGPRMSRYHRADCVLVRGKELGWIAMTDPQIAGRTPCEVCTP
jgi:hypothetical protein